MELRKLLATSWELKGKKCLANLDPKLNRFQKMRVMFQGKVKTAAARLGQAPNRTQVNWVVQTVVPRPVHHLPNNILVQYYKKGSKEPFLLFMGSSLY